MARDSSPPSIQALLAAERDERAKVRGLTHAERSRERDERLQQRLEQASYFGQAAVKVDQLNQDLVEKCEAIESLLHEGVMRCNTFDWGTLKRFVSERDREGFLHSALQQRPREESYIPEKPPLLNRLVPGWKGRYERDVASARDRFQADLRAFEGGIEARRRKLASLETEAAQYNRLIDECRAAYQRSEPDAVRGFFHLVFEMSDYPQGFPTDLQCAFMPESKQLVVDFEVPTVEDAVPSVERYRLVKSTNQINETKKSQKSRQALYQSLVAQCVLRKFLEVFVSDGEGVVDVVTVNAFVSSIDRSTGQRVRPCVVSARTTRQEFQQLDLRHVDPLACLKRLNAAISRSPSELVAVKPIIELNMADPRFIKEQDVLGTLDNRPNLMELSPSEFENLVTNLFQKMGLETKLTQASRDGGVDCVAFDPRPVLGGKVIVQAKRYKNTVGVSAVRDLFWTVHNEGAAKGILVTTSGYGSAAYEFANGKPLELMDGGNLLYLLKEYVGVEAKIIMPDDWKDQPPEF